MSARDTQELIRTAVERFTEQVPALKPLTLVIRLELRARGDAPIWRVEVPGPKIAKDPAGDARLDVSIARPDFNKLAEATLKEWAQVRVTGDAAVIKLLGNVVQRQLARVR